jgi:hypothetical protein
MRPEDVGSPQDRIRDLRVVYSDVDGNWSIAEMTWCNHAGQWARRIGMRWNGKDGELGNPQSSGHPTWFLLPDGEITQMISEYGERLARQR